MKAYVLFAGDQDQGILYVSQMFIEAATEEGWHAVCLSSSARGKVVQCLVAISDSPLTRPSHSPPDVALLSSLDAADLLEYSVKPDGLLIMNASRVRRPPRRHDVDVVMALTESDDGEGDPVRASVILLGALVSLTGWISPERVANILQKSCKDRRLCEAFQRGVVYVEGIGRMTESRSMAAGIGE